MRPLYRLASYGLAGSVRAVSPALYLWPWLAALLVYAAFIASSQGDALAIRYIERHYSAVVVVSVVTATWFVVAFASLVAMVAVAASRQSFPGTRRSLPRLRLHIAAGIDGVWMAFLSTAYVMLFATAASSDAALYTGIALCAVSVSVIAWVVTSLRRNGSSALNALHWFKRHRIILASLSMMSAVVPLGVGAFVTVTDPLKLADAGPLLIGMIGLAATSTLFGVVLIVLPLCVRRMWLGAAFVATMMSWALMQPTDIDEDNPLLREEARVASSTIKRSEACTWVPTSVGSSLAEHIDGASTDAEPPIKLDSNRNIYLVSAEGGGIRAAYWTAINLAQLDIATDGRFAEEVVSLSGVSGGSLGVATWLAARERHDLSLGERREIIIKYLGSDFLSSLIGGFLFLDVPRVLLGPVWPSIRRDQVFERTLADMWKEVGKTDFFARRVRDLCINGFEKAPAIFFNATDAQTGAYVALAKGDSRSASSLERTTLANATVAQMVHISARFPYLSPPAQVGIDASVLAAEAAERDMRIRKNAGRLTEEQENSVKRDIEAMKKSVRAQGLHSRLWVLVDGGYFDNTGLTPTRDALSMIRSERKSEVGLRDVRSRRYTLTEVRVVHFSNDPGVICLKLPVSWRNFTTPRTKRFLEVTKKEPRCGFELLAIENSLAANPFAFLFAPLQGILSVRGEHSRQALAQLKSEIWNREDKTSVKDFSLHEALKSAYGFNPKPSPLLRSPGDPRGILKGLVPEWRQLVEAASLAGTLSKDDANAYLRKLDAWESEIVAGSSRANCRNDLAPLAPPLGWTLSGQSESLMQCLTFRLAYENSFAFAPPPLPPLPQGFPRTEFDYWGSILQNGQRERTVPRRPFYSQ
jgi:hypothetical protein